MNYHDMTRDDMLNGDGLRAVLWLSGCAHACEDCQNPQTWDPAGGLPFDEAAQRELFSLLERDYIAGLTLTGGDPLFTGNRDGVYALLTRFRERFPLGTKTVWLYTGYTFEEILAYEGLALIDVLVDGKYEKKKKNTLLPWRGSENQRVIDVQKSLREKRVCILS